MSSISSRDFALELEIRSAIAAHGADSVVVFSNRKIGTDLATQLRTDDSRAFKRNPSAAAPAMALDILPLQSLGVLACAVGNMLTIRCADNVIPISHRLWVFEEESRVLEIARPVDTTWGRINAYGRYSRAKSDSDLGTGILAVLTPEQYHDQSLECNLYF